MKRVVIDTNVIISGLIKKESTPGEILRAWMENKFILLLSPQIFEEVSRVIRHPKVRQYHVLQDEEIEDFLLNLYSSTQETEGKIDLDVVDDPDDNIFIACAIEGNAEYVVTGDKIFLKLKEYKGIKIITPSQFLKKEIF